MKRICKSNLLPYILAEFLTCSSTASLDHSVGALYYLTSIFIFNHCSSIYVFFFSYRLTYGDQIVWTIYSFTGQLMQEFQGIFLIVVKMLKYTTLPHIKPLISKGTALSSGNTGSESEMNILVDMRDISVCSRNRK